jgi:hypothetical protein
MRGLMRTMLPLPLMLASQASAQPTLAERASPLVLAADAPVPVWINGLEVVLALSTGTVDHITLNDESVGRIGLSAAPPDNTADLIFGGQAVLKGRHGRAWMAQGGQLVPREAYWFPGESRLPLAGTIGTFALPHWRVQVEWPVPATGATAEVVQLPLIGGIDRAAYGVQRMGRKIMAVGVDVRTRRPLPMVTAAIGADLAEELGGRMVGDVWQEQIMMGVARPLRRLELDRPLMIGPIRITAVAVRQGGPRDATVTLTRGQKIPFDAEEDPEIQQVRGRIVRRRQTARYIMLSRTQLEAAGCTSLLVDKQELTFTLSCAPPAQLPAVAATAARNAMAAVAVATPAGPLIEPVLPPEPETLLSLTEPVSVTIEGRPLRLVLGEAGREGLRLNGRVAQQTMEDRLRRLSADARAAGQMADAAELGQLAFEVRRALPDDVFNLLENMPRADKWRAKLGISRSPIAPKTLLTSLDVTLVHAGRQAQAVATWLEGVAGNRRRLDRSEPFDGRIALAALPGSRVRLRLGASPLAGGTPGAGLALSIADRSRDQGVMGVASVPGIDAMFIGLELGLGVDMPVVSMALGQDLIRLHGGQYGEPMQSVRTADDRQRLFRPMQLATPLIVGPLRLDRVLVEQVPRLGNWLNWSNWPDRRPWPDIKGVAGLERELRVPPAVLRAAGCHELAIDKPGRAWTLSCSPVSAPPAP